MPSTYSIPKIYEDEIEAVVDAGYYSSKSDVIRDALRFLFESKKNLKISAAIEMYKKGKVTLSKAAEIAGIDTVSFKEILKDRGIKIKIKGRFNGAPRARHKIIQIGTGIPALTISSKIDYGEITSYTANGTFGVKVWIHEKN